MCAEHRGGAHQDDEAKSEQFSLRGKKSLQARSQETQVGGSMGLWLGLGVLQAAEIATNFFLAKILPRIVNKLSNGDQILTQQ